MKRIVVMLMIIAMSCSFCACGNTTRSDELSEAETAYSDFYTTNSYEETETELLEGNAESTEFESEKDESLEAVVIESETLIETNSSKIQSMNIQEFDDLLSTQRVRVTSTNYVVQDEKYKSLYPDMLQAVIQNDTQYDIKNAVVAFVAWDANNLPVKIKGSVDFSDGSYIKLVNYNDINLIPGDSFGSDSGFSVDEECGIKTFKAIVVSYEAFTGETWENPLYDEWCKFYEGVKLVD